MSNVFVKDTVSEIDATVYDVEALGASSIVGTVKFFSQSVSAGLNRTNLTTPNMLPSNWKKFTVKNIGLKFFSRLVTADFYTAIQDAYYSFKIADTEIKFGHASELINTVDAIVTNTTTNGGKAPNDFGHSINALLPLLIDVTIPSSTSFYFDLTFDTDVTSLHGIYVGCFMHGVLERLIAG